jgi:hypothetical protein
MGLRIYYCMLLFFAAGLSRLACSQAPPAEPADSEIQIETAVVDISSLQFTVARIYMDRPLPFSFVLPETAARSLVTTPAARILQSPLVPASFGKNTRIRMYSRVPAEDSQYVEAGIDMDILPKKTPAGELSMAIDLGLRVIRGENGQPIYAGRKMHHDVRIASGRANVLGGLIAAEDVAALTRIPGLQSVPMLSLLFSEKDADRELMIILFPRVPTSVPKITAEPVNAVVSDDRSLPASLYSVQVGAFANRTAADSLKADLEQHFEGVFIETFRTDRILYRVRVGKFVSIEDARKLESELRAAGKPGIIVRPNRTSVR